MIDRAAEAAAIAAHVAAGKVKVLPPVDDGTADDRAIKIWRAEKTASKGPGGGLRVMNSRRLAAPKKPKREAVVEPKAKPSQDAAGEPLQDDFIAGRTGIRIKPGAGGNPAPKRSHKKKSAAARACAKHGIIDCVRRRIPTVAELAYMLWELDGYAHGHDVEHWLVAEEMLR